MSDIIYTPTQWVDNTEPSINADNLNHIEQGILAATNAARSVSNAISDAFSTEKSYAAGDYCIYLNSLYKFTTAKAAGPWDGTAVVPTTISGELNSLNDDMEVISIPFIPQPGKVFEQAYTHAYRCGDIVDIGFILNDSGSFAGTHIASIEVNLSQQIFFPVYSLVGGNVIARGTVQYNGNITILNETSGTLSRPIGHCTFIVK